MASLKDAQDLTQRLREQADALHQQLVDGEVDFAKIVELADDVGAAADRVATTFQAIEEAFAERLDEDSGDGAQGAKAQAAGATSTSGRGDRNGGASDGGDLSEALSPQRRSRSSKGRGRSGDSPTRQELLQRARKADITGRSEMSKQELIDSLRKAGKSVA